MTKEHTDDVDALEYSSRYADLLQKIPEEPGGRVTESMILQAVQTLDRIDSEDTLFFEQKLQQMETELIKLFGE